MLTTRRELLQVSASTGALLALDSLARARDASRAQEKKLSILILGGTGFLGPAIVEAAKPRGHKITLFNRGKTNPGLFPDLEKIQGDRDPNIGEGIKALANRKWDVVFDDCGYFPRHVKASVEMLAPNISHYVYVSSISCYAKNDVENMDEDAAVGTMPERKPLTLRRCVVNTTTRDEFRKSWTFAGGRNVGIVGLSADGESITYVVGTMDGSNPIALRDPTAVAEFRKMEAEALAQRPAKWGSDAAHVLGRLTFAVGPRHENDDAGVTKEPSVAKGQLSKIEFEPEAGDLEPIAETMGNNYEYYGPLKVQCEQAAEAAMPGKVCVVRPGYIVGPNDPTDRFTYWPARFDLGGDVVVPGAPTDPLQIIDVRDLGEWMVHVAEHKVTGRFNACGPEKKLEWGKVIDACVAAGGNKGKPHWASLEVLEKFPDAQFQIWSPYAGETKGFHMVSNARAVKAGLKFRPIDVIVKDTLAWFKGLPADRQASLFKSHDERVLKPETAKQILAAL